MCAACHSENKSLSLPANRLLRDELNQEADEIMSELKNMQDLYIGRDAELDETDCKNPDEDVVVVEMENDGKGILAGSWNDYQTTLAVEQKEQQEENFQQPDEPNKVLQQMSRFIEDWLRPSTFQGEGNDIWHVNKSKGVDKNVDAATATENAHGIWYANNEKNIWQPKDCLVEMNEEVIEHKRSERNSFDAWKPMEFLRQLNVVEPKIQQSKEDDDAFLTELSWEHEHLAAIWKNSTPVNLQVAPGENSWPNTTPKLQQQQQQREESKQSTEQSERVRTFLKYLGVIQQKEQEEFGKCKGELGKVEKHKNVLKAEEEMVTHTMAKSVGNRKRRHSESLNYYELLEEHTFCCSNGNNKLFNKKDLINKIGTTMNPSSSTILNTSINSTTTDTDDNNTHEKEYEYQNKYCGKLATQMDENMVNEYGIMNANDDNVNLVNDGLFNLDGAMVVVATCDNENDPIQCEQSETIITCKYWTTTADSKKCCKYNKTKLIKDFAIVDDNHDYAHDVVDNDDEAITEFSGHFDKHNASILRHVTTALVARPLTR